MHTIEKQVKVYRYQIVISVPSYIYVFGLLHSFQQLFYGFEFEPERLISRSMDNLQEMRDFYFYSRSKHVINILSTPQYFYLNKSFINH